MVHRRSIAGAHDSWPSAPIDCLYERSGTFVLRLHLQFRISGMSSPYVSMYCLCSISLSCLLRFRRRAGRRSGQAVDGVHDEVEAVQIVQHRHVEGGGDRALFLVAADVDVVVVRAAVGQPVNQPRVAMEGEDDRLVRGEEFVEVRVAQPVRVLGVRLQPHEVDDVDDADLEVGQMRPHDRDGGERLQRRHVAAAGHDHVGRHALVVAGPLPDADALDAVLDGRVHRQPLRRRVFARDHDVDVVAAAQAVVHHREEAVGVGGR